jgi:hypothetical protein
MTKRARPWEAPTEPRHGEDTCYLLALTNEDVRFLIWDLLLLSERAVLLETCKALRDEFQARFTRNLSLVQPLAGIEDVRLVDGVFSLINAAAALHFRFGVRWVYVPYAVYAKLFCDDLSSTNVLHLSVGDGYWMLEALVADFLRFHRAYAIRADDLSALVHALPYVIQALPHPRRALNTFFLPFGT